MRRPNKLGRHKGGEGGTMLAACESKGYLARVRMNLVALLSPLKRDVEYELNAHLRPNVWYEAPNLTRNRARGSSQFRVEGFGSIGDKVRCGRDRGWEWKKKPSVASLGLTDFRYKVVNYGAVKSPWGTNGEDLMRK